ncbi:hypothetical protein [Sphingobium olei]|uniref:Uncharacterized protein n=1 Tax=Sphingobium olei TaxID=420955 RepID=A0ABW3NYU2_9SPHN
MKMVDSIKAAALVAYIEHGGSADIMEHLTHGDGRNVPPNAIGKMIEAALRALEVPTMEMLNAATDATGAGSDMSWSNRSPQTMFEQAWSAMIAAAREE